MAFPFGSLGGTARKLVVWRGSWGIAQCPHVHLWNLDKRGGGNVVVGERPAMGNPLAVLVQSEANKFIEKIWLLADPNFSDDPTYFPQCWLHNKLHWWAELPCDYVRSHIPQMNHNHIKWWNTFSFRYTLYIYDWTAQEKKKT